MIIAYLAVDSARANRWGYQVSVNCNDSGLVLSFARINEGFNAELRVINNRWVIVVSLKES